MTKYVRDIFQTVLRIYELSGSSVTQGVRSVMSYLYVMFLKDFAYNRVHSVCRKSAVRCTSSGEDVLTASLIETYLLDISDDGIANNRNQGHYLRFAALSSSEEESLVAPVYILKLRPVTSLHLIPYTDRRSSNA